MQVCIFVQTDDIVSTAEAARILGKTVSTVNRWAAEGKLVAVLQMPGETGARLFRRADIEAKRNGEPTEASA